MGGWADGITTRELGTDALVDVVWVGFEDKIGGRKATLSIACTDGEQVWTGLDVDAWKELIEKAEEAIEFLSGDTD